MPTNGFSYIVIIIIVAVLLAGSIAFTAGRRELLGGVYPERSRGTQVIDSGAAQGKHDNEVSSQTEWPVLWGPPDNQYKCQKNTSVKFSSLPLKLEDISYVQPIGELREGHIIPGDHAGIDYKTSPSSTPVQVYAPADGFLVRVEKHPYQPPPGYPKDIQHYHVYLEHSCTLFTGFVHLTQFNPEILAKSSGLEQLTKYRGTEQKYESYRIPVKAGQSLGTAWSFGLLGWVTVDLTRTNKGYLNPQSYKGENWRAHSVSGFDYFEESLKSQIMAKNPRSKDPRGGKIDFDIEGKLVGGWFEKGTGGFRDERGMAAKQCGNFPCPYWDGHIAFVYDYVDPAQLRLSVGHNWGISDGTPYGVKGNGPDFAGIGVEDGLVKYELVALKDVSREKGYVSETALVTVNDESKMLGIMLVQVEDKNTIKVEIFPDKTKDSISAFTPNARIYNR